MRKFVPGIYSLSEWIVKHDDAKQSLRKDGGLWGLLPPLSITSRGRVIAGCSGMDSQISVPMATIFAVVRAVSNRRRAKAWPLWCWITCAEEGLENRTNPASGGKHPPTHRRTHAQETHTRCCLLLRRNLSMAVIKKESHQQTSYVYYLTCLGNTGHSRGVYLFTAMFTYILNTEQLHAKWSRC